VKLAHSQGDPFSPPVFEDAADESEQTPATPNKDAQADTVPDPEPEKPAKKTRKGKAAPADDDELKAKLDAALAELDDGK
jgi:hypothetical protein